MASKQGSLANITIDVKDRFAWMRIVAALAWGGDPQRMDEALATYAAELNATLRDVMTARPQPPSLRSLCLQMGVTPDELARMPGTSLFFDSYFSKPLENMRAVMRGIFEPAGHFRAVAHAPGSEQMLLDYQRAAEGGAFFAGVLLSIVAILARHHADAPASLNRAIAVMQGWSERRLMKVPTERTLLAEWKKWRHLAPLWASAIGNQQQTQNRGGLSPAAAALEALLDPIRLRQTLGHAKSFRTFSGSFVPDRAREPLIPLDISVAIVAQVEEIAPPLAPLPPADLAAAKRYRAPTRKYDQ